MCAAFCRPALWACVRVCGSMGEGCSVPETSESLDIDSRAPCPVSAMQCLPFRLSAFAIVCACLCMCRCIMWVKEGGWDRQDRGSAAPVNVRGEHIWPARGGVTHLVGKAGRQRHGDRHHWDKRRRVHEVDLDLLGRLDAGELMDRDGVGDVGRGGLQSRRRSGASRRVAPVHLD